MRAVGLDLRRTVLAAVIVSEPWRFSATDFTEAERVRAGRKLTTSLY